MKGLKLGVATLVVMSLIIGAYFLGIRNSSLSHQEVSRAPKNLEEVAELDSEFNRQHLELDNHLADVKNRIQTVKLNLELGESDNQVTSTEISNRLEELNERIIGATVSDTSAGVPFPPDSPAGKLRNQPRTESGIPVSVLRNYEKETGVSPDEVEELMRTFQGRPRQMKINLKWMLAGAAMSFSYVTFAQDTPVNNQEIYAELRSQMERACPAVWEDLGATMDTESLNGDPWSNNQADKDQFVALLQEIIPSSSAEDRASMSGDMATVATECASHRVALLDALISKTPRDVLLAMDAVNKGLNKSIEYLDGGWSTGDVRVTGRMQAQDGWVFLVGQTVGNESSAAVLKGDEFNELYELAKNWAPNTGAEDWTAGHLVTLPDMRGRALVGTDNMGGGSANTVGEASADKVGGTFGEETRVLSAAQLPRHKHTMTAKGAHNHTMGNDTHSHRMRTSTYLGSATPRAGWDYFGDARPRETYNFTYVANKTILSDTHKHSLSSAPNHTHAINNAGSSAAVKLSQPSVVFNVEMKY